MIHIGKCKEEYRDENLPSIRELVDAKPIESKAEVLAYMKKWDTGARAPKIFRDAITGEIVPTEYCCYCDGKFVWCTDAVYYFEKYNLKLDNKFIEHILSQE